VQLRFRPRPTLLAAGAALALAACTQASAVGPPTSAPPPAAAKARPTWTSFPAADRNKALDVLDGVRQCDRLIDCRNGVVAAVAQANTWAAGYPGTRVASEADRLRQAVAAWAGYGCNEHARPECTTLDEDVRSAAEGVARAVLEGQQ
jgi:hypothetical protein